MHNQVFLEGVKSALLAPKGTTGGGVMANGESKRELWSREEKDIGLKALSRVYAGWCVLHPQTVDVHRAKLAGSQGLQSSLLPAKTARKALWLQRLGIIHGGLLGGMGLLQRSVSSTCRPSGSLTWLQTPRICL